MSSESSVASEISLSRADMPSLNMRTDPRLKKLSMQWTTRNSWVVVLLLNLPRRLHVEVDVKVAIEVPVEEVVPLQLTSVSDAIDSVTGLNPVQKVTAETDTASKRSAISVVVVATSRETAEEEVAQALSTLDAATTLTTLVIDV